MRDTFNSSALFKLQGGDGLVWTGIVVVKQILLVGSAQPGGSSPVLDGKSELSEQVDVEIRVDCPMQNPVAVNKTLSVEEGDKHCFA